jgi:DNA-binding IclR family transcriptional regulator
MARPAPGAERSVAVLELLAAHPDERFTLSEVARRCDLNKATAHALLNALSERGVLLRHPEEKRYSLGPVLVTIGEAALRGYTAVDFVGPTLRRLARDTGLWARAWVVDGDHIGVVEDAGRPPGLATGGPLRLPLVPPLGVLGMAYADAATVQAWLARAPAAEGAAAASAALPEIRRLGFVVTMATPEWRALTGSGRRRLRAVADADASPVRALLAATAHQPLLLADLAGASTHPAEITAPVFERSGRVALALSLTTITDEAVSMDRVRQLAATLVASADELTTMVGGLRR